MAASAGRWINKLGTSTNCYTGDDWDKSICPDPTTCASNCGLEGISADQYSNTYGVVADGQGSLSLKFVTNGQYAKNVGSRLFLLDDDSTCAGGHL